jgi:hypothetical protein
MRCFIISFLCQILLGVNKSWKRSWVKHVAYMGNIRIAYEILVKKCEGIRLLGRKRHRRENTGVGCIDMN